MRDSHCPSVYNIGTSYTGRQKLKALLLADIHSNLEALEAVLRDCVDFDTIWCMGDVVGYGPDPGPCLDILREHNHLCVAGNHDHVVGGLLSIEAFNDAAAEAALWTTTQLTADQIRYLAELPFVLEEGNFTLVHGSLRSPVWEYLISEEVAAANLSLMKTPFCIVGHSHLPFICREMDTGPLFSFFPERQPVPLAEQRWMINPGGVGQPRDGDPRPSYALYDSSQGTLERRRVTYDIAKTQRKMALAGLPPPLIRRLDLGK